MDTKDFFSAIDLVFNRAGLTEIKQRAESLGISYEYCRKIFNERRVPADEILMVGLKKANATQEDIFRILILAAQARTSGVAADTWSAISGKVEPEEGNAVMVEMPVTPNKIPLYGSIRAGSAHGGMEGEQILGGSLSCFLFSRSIKTLS